MKKQKPYIDRINEAIVEYRRKARPYSATDAWENRNEKGYQRIVPRGRVYRRLMKPVWEEWTKPLEERAYALSIKYNLYET